MNDLNTPWWKQINRHDLLKLLLLIVSAIITYGVMVLPLSINSDVVQLSAGQVAPRDFQANENKEYISEVRTEQARQAAEKAVADVYTTPDTLIARRQVERLRAALQFIQSVRDDISSPTIEKQNRLTTLADVRLSQVGIERAINFSESRWSAVQVETFNLLERIMRSAVRENNQETTLANLPSMVSFSMTEEQTALIVELVTPFIVPNSFFSEEMTQTAREQARQAIQPITQTYLIGEMVVPRGKVLTESDLEALKILGLVRPSDPSLDQIGSLGLVSSVAIILGLYFQRRHPMFSNESRNLVLIAVLFISFLIIARFVIPGRTLVPYIFPVPGFGMLITTLFGPGGAILLSLALCILAAYGMPNSLDLTFYFLFASLAGIFALGRGQRFGAFLWASLVTALTGAISIVAYRVPTGSLDVVGFFQLLAAALMMGLLSSSLALMLQYLLAEFLGLTTPLRLVEISRPDSPLLQYFLRNAPGTYQHSLMVSNLAEQAAEKLGMDTLLVRVGALYHDIGKALNPLFFIENQMPDNLNPHHDLDPQVAAQTVIRHVTDGVTLAKKYRLPRRIQDFMLEHHGTLMTRYQYNKALEAAGGDKSLVDETQFHYPGPRPRSRETALLMLADNVEARARAERPRNEAEIRALVQKALDYCQKEDQLSETRFTLKDLGIISEFFVTTLTGLYHPRISYPSAEIRANQENPTRPNPSEKA